MQAVAELTTNEKITPATGKARLRDLSHVDGRTRAMQRVRALMAAIENDLGGRDHLTLGQRQLVQRAAVLGAVIEDSEARWAAGAPFEVSNYLAAINAQRRVLATLGLQRVARDVTDLETYVTSREPRPPVAPMPAKCFRRIRRILSLPTTTPMPRSGTTRTRPNEDRALDPRCDVGPQAAWPAFPGC
jgi:hypothetical protein